MSTVPYLFQSGTWLLVTDMPRNPEWCLPLASILNMLTIINYGKLGLKLLRWSTYLNPWRKRPTRKHVYSCSLPPAPAD